MERAHVREAHGFVQRDAGFIGQRDAGDQDVKALAFGGWKEGGIQSAAEALLMAKQAAMPDASTWPMS